MTMLLSTSITAPVTAAVSQPLQLRPVGGVIAQSVALQANFVYGSGGTTVDAWVQTSIDGGNTWIDAFALGLTSSP
jgi:hypothetical protein